MAKQTYSDFVQEIYDGKHDDELEAIQNVASWRLKNRFRKGAKVVLTGTSNANLEGKEGVVLRVNPKTIQVGVGMKEVSEWGTTYSDGTFNVPPRMLVPKAVA